MANNINFNVNAYANFSQVQTEISKLKASIATLQAQPLLGTSGKQTADEIQAVQKRFDQMVLSTRAFNMELVKSTDHIDELGSSIERGKLGLHQYYDLWRNRNAQAKNQLDDLADSQARVAKSFVIPDALKTGYSRVITSINADLKTLGATQEAMNIKTKALNSVIRGMGTELINLGKNTQWTGRQLTVGLTVPMVAFGAQASKVFQDVDKELTRLAKVYGTGLTITSQQTLDTIRKQTLDLARELATAYGVTAQQTAAAAADLAATGLQGQELIKSTREVLRLSTLGEIDQQSAIKATIALQQTFKLSAMDTAKAVDFLNAVENQTSTSMGDLVESLPRASNVIKQLGGSYKDLSVMMVALREAGVPAAEGANAIKSAMASLINPSRRATESFSEFGLNLEAITKKNSGNLLLMMKDLQVALDSIDPTDKARLIENIFGKFQFAKITALINNLGTAGSQTEQVFKLSMASSTQLAAIAAKELEKQANSVSGRYNRAIQEFRSQLLPLGEQFTKWATKAMNIFSKLLEVVNKFGALKNILVGALGGAAIVGPVLMLSGLMINLVGSLVKGANFFRMWRQGFKGIGTEASGLKGAFQGIQNYFEMIDTSSLAASHNTDMLAQNATNATQAFAILNREIQKLSENLLDIAGHPITPYIPNTKYATMSKDELTALHLYEADSKQQGGERPHYTSKAEALKQYYANPSATPQLQAVEASYITKHGPQVGAEKFKQYFEEGQMSQYGMVPQGSAAGLLQRRYGQENVIYGNAGGPSRDEIFARETQRLIDIHDQIIRGKIKDEELAGEELTRILGFTSQKGRQLTDAQIAELEIIIDKVVFEASQVNKSVVDNLVAQKTLLSGSETAIDELNAQVKRIMTSGDSQSRAGRVSVAWQQFVDTLSANAVREINNYRVMVTSQISGAATPQAALMAGRNLEAEIALTASRQSKSFAEQLGPGETMGAQRLKSTIVGFSGPTKKLQSGGSAWVPGTGDGDKVPAMLEPGEFVVNKNAAKQYGGVLHDINFNRAPRFQNGGRIPGFMFGGYTDRDGNKLSASDMDSIPTDIAFKMLQQVSPEMMKEIGVRTRNAQKGDTWELKGSNGLLIGDTRNASRISINSDLDQNGVSPREFLKAAMSGSRSTNPGEQMALRGTHSKFLDKLLEIGEISKERHRSALRDFDRRYITELLAMESSGTLLTDKNNPLARIQSETIASLNIPDAIGAFRQWTEEKVTISAKNRDYADRGRGGPSTSPRGAKLLYGNLALEMSALEGSKKSGTLFAHAINRGFINNILALKNGGNVPGFVSGGQTVGDIWGEGQRTFRAAQWQGPRLPIDYGFQTRTPELNRHPFFATREEAEEYVATEVAMKSLSGTEKSELASLREFVNDETNLNYLASVWQQNTSAIRNNPKRLETLLSYFMPLKEAMTLRRKTVLGVPGEMPTEQQVSILDALSSGSYESIIGKKINLTGNPSAYTEWGFDWLQGKDFEGNAQQREFRENQVIKAKEKLGSAKRQVEALNDPNPQIAAMSKRYLEDRFRGWRSGVPFEENIATYLNMHEEAIVSAQADLAKAKPMGREPRDVMFQRTFKPGTSMLDISAVNPNEKYRGIPLMEREWITGPGNPTIESVSQAWFPPNKMLGGQRAYQHAIENNLFPYVLNMKQRGGIQHLAQGTKDDEYNLQELANTWQQGPKGIRNYPDKLEALLRFFTPIKQAMTLRRKSMLGVPGEMPDAQQIAILKALESGNYESILGSKFTLNGRPSAYTEWGPEWLMAREFHDYPLKMRQAGNMVSNAQSEIENLERFVANLQSPDKETAKFAREQLVKRNSVFKSAEDLTPENIEKLRQAKQRMLEMQIESQKALSPMGMKPRDVIFQRLFGAGTPMLDITSANPGGKYRGTKLMEKEWLANPGEPILESISQAWIPPDRYMGGKHLYPEWVRNLPYVLNMKKRGGTIRGFQSGDEVPPDKRGKFYDSDISPEEMFSAGISAWINGEWWGKRDKLNKQPLLDLMRPISRGKQDMMRATVLNPGVSYELPSKQQKMLMDAVRSGNYDDIFGKEVDFSSVTSWSSMRDEGSGPYGFMGIYRFILHEMDRIQYAKKIAGPDGQLKSSRLGPEGAMGAFFRLISGDKTIGRDISYGKIGNYKTLLNEILLGATSGNITGISSDLKTRKPIFHVQGHQKGGIQKLVKGGVKTPFEQIIGKRAQRMGAESPGREFIPVTPDDILGSPLYHGDKTGALPSELGSRGAVQDNWFQGDFFTTSSQKIASQYDRAGVKMVSNIPDQQRKLINLLEGGPSIMTQSSSLFRSIYMNFMKGGRNRLKIQDPRAAKFHNDYEYALRDIAWSTPYGDRSLESELKKFQARQDLVSNSLAKIGGSPLEFNRALDRYNNSKKIPLKSKNPVEQIALDAVHAKREEAKILRIGRTIEMNYRAGNFEGASEEDIRKLKELKARKAPHKFYNTYADGFVYQEGMLGRHGKPAIGYRRTEIFENNDVLRKSLLQNGYTGLVHTGGLATHGDPHNVAAWFDPTGIKTKKLQQGGSPWVPGSGNGDRVPAMLEPGEFVVNKNAAKQYGGLLHHLNWNAAPRFATGSGEPGKETLFGGIVNKLFGPLTTGMQMAAGAERSKANRGQTRETDPTKIVAQITVSAKAFKDGVDSITTPIDAMRQQVVKAEVGLQDLATSIRATSGATAQSAKEAIKERKQKVKDSIPTRDTSLQGQVRKLSDADKKKWIFGAPNPLEPEGQDQRGLVPKYEKPSKMGNLLSKAKGLTGMTGSPGFSMGGMMAAQVAAPIISGIANKIVGDNQIAKGAVNTATQWGSMGAMLGPEGAIVAGAAGAIFGGVTSYMAKTKAEAKQAADAISVSTTTSTDALKILGVRIGDFSSATVLASNGLQKPIDKMQKIINALADSIKGAGDAETQNALKNLKEGDQTQKTSQLKDVFQSTLMSTGSQAKATQAVKAWMKASGMDLAQQGSILSSKEFDPAGKGRTGNELSSLLGRTDQNKNAGANVLFQASTTTDIKTFSSQLSKAFTSGNLNKINNSGVAFNQFNNQVRATNPSLATLNSHLFKSGAQLSTIAKVDVLAANGFKMTAGQAEYLTKNLKMLTAVTDLASAAQSVQIGAQPFIDRMYKKDENWAKTKQKALKDTTTQINNQIKAQNNFIKSQQNGINAIQKEIDARQKLWDKKQEGIQQQQTLDNLAKNVNEAQASGDLIGLALAQNAYNKELKNERELKEKQAKDESDQKRIANLQSAIDKANGVIDTLNEKLNTAQTKFDDTADKSTNFGETAEKAIEAVRDDVANGKITDEKTLRGALHKAGLTAGEVDTAFANIDKDGNFQKIVDNATVINKALVGVKDGFQRQVALALMMGGMDADKALKQAGLAAINKTSVTPKGGATVVANGKTWVYKDTKTGRWSDPKPNEVTEDNWEGVGWYQTQISPPEFSTRQPKGKFTQGKGKYATGGYISGPGGPTSDMIPAMLSNGEYVVKASAVSQYGTQLLDSINNKKFATGGLARNYAVGGSVGDNNNTSFSDNSVYNINVTANTNASADDIAQTVIKAIQRQQNALTTSRNMGSMR